VANPKILPNVSRKISQVVSSSPTANTDGFNFTNVTPDSAPGTTITVNTADITSRLYPITIQDVSGLCSPTRAISVVTEGGELINGSVSGITLNSAYESVTMQSDGSNLYTLNQNSAVPEVAVIPAASARDTSNTVLVQDSEEAIIYNSDVTTAYFEIIASTGLITCQTSGSYLMEFDAQIEWNGPLGNSASAAFYYRLDGAIQNNDVTYCSVNGNLFGTQYTRSIFLPLTAGQTIQWFYYQPSVLGASFIQLRSQNVFPAVVNTNAASVKFWFVG
jgi:hypothetical protein